MGQRIQSLDALRGVAVILVILVHSRPDLFPGGWIGVDLFFVISGFLMTRQIAEGRTPRDFYAARFGRIVPPAVATAGIVGIASLALPEGRYLTHFWTIAVEAGFYALWPIVLTTPRRYWPVMFVAILAGLIAWRFAATTNYYIMHMDGLLWGALLASTGLAERLRPFAPLAAAGLLYAVLTATPDSPRLALALTVIPALCAIVVARGWQSEPLAKVGLLSFSLYLWHYPIVTALEALSVRGAWLWALPVATMAALASRRYVETLPLRLAHDQSRHGSFSAASILRKAA